MLIERAIKILKGKETVDGFESVDELVQFTNRACLDDEEWIICDKCMMPHECCECEMENIEYDADN